jgi:hypothetical protein
MRMPAIAFALGHKIEITRHTPLTATALSGEAENEK